MTETPTSQDADGRRFRAAAAAIAVIAFALVMVETDASISDMTSVGRVYTSSMTVLAICILLVRVCLDLIVRIVASRLGRSAQMRAAPAVLARINWRDIVTALFALSITATSFTVYKTLHISETGYDWDPLFIAWDRAFFLGHDPWEISHSLFSSANATRIIDHLYHGAFMPMIVGYLFCVALHDKPALRYTYMLCYLGGFVLVGMLMAAWLSSAGPIYDGQIYGDGQTFAPLIDRLAAQSAEMPQIRAVRLQDYLLRIHETDGVGFGSGISAMPSMHIVLVLIWMFAAWHIHKVIGLVMAAYTAIIWIGSVHLGWHYFVDGLVSLVVIWALWRVVGTSFGLYQRPQVIRATT